VPQPLIISGTLANVDSSVSTEDLIQYLSDRLPEGELHRLKGATAAAFDWALVLETSAQVATIASLLWQAYKHLVEPTKTEEESDAGIYIIMGEEQAHQFWIGKDIQDEEACLKYFLRISKQVSVDPGVIDRTRSLLREIHDSNSWARVGEDAPNERCSTADELIYQNANTYRLHADNLRWTLLGGYAAFVAAVLAATSNNPTSLVFLLLSICSGAYLLILAVQNWFYNLFARFVDDCEFRLARGIRLRTLKDFTYEASRTVNPFHPAFLFALAIVAVAAYVFAVLFAETLYIPLVSEWLNDWFLSGVRVVFYVVSFYFYFRALHRILLLWDEWVFQPIILRLSNLYKPLL
jgi:hypothetical protein